MITSKPLDIFDDHTHTPCTRGTFQTLLPIGPAVQSSQYFQVEYYVSGQLFPRTWYIQRHFTGGNDEKSLESEFHRRQASVL